jgi:phage replication O-like protein O
MANPQLEDGHTQIANEILEQMMKLHLSGNQWQVLLCIIRKTYGFKKKVDYIANFQIQKATGLGKSVVSRTLRELQARNIITRNGKISGLQKNWESWKVSRIANPEKLAESSTKLAKLSTELPKLSKKVSSPVVAQKKKETIQKKLYKRKHGEFQNVLLTDEEYQWLKDKFQDRTDEYIERLSVYLESIGKDKYKSHYATILNWYRRDKEKGGKDKSRRLPGKEEYEPTADYGD